MSFMHHCDSIPTSGVIIVLINVPFALSQAFYTSLAIHRACIAKPARRGRERREKTRLALVNGVNVAGKTESRATRAERESQRGAFRGRPFRGALARSRNEHDRVPRGQERGQETSRWRINLGAVLEKSPAKRERDRSQAS